MLDEKINKRYKNNNQCLQFSNSNYATQQRNKNGILY